MKTLNQTQKKKWLPLQMIGQIIATFRLLNTYFWRTIYGPVLSFVVPGILLAILGNVLRIQYVFPGIISLSIMIVGVLNLPLAMMELKNSTLLKFIGTTRITKHKFVISAVFFYILIILVSVMILIILGFIFFKKDIYLNGQFHDGLYSGLFSIKGFFNFLFALALATMLAVLIGMFIASFSKTVQQALTISLSVAIISMFLSGMIVSVDIIAQSKTMQWISRFIPFRYTTGNLVVSTTPLPQTKSFMEVLTPQQFNMIFAKDSVPTSAHIGIVTNTKSAHYGEFYIENIIGKNGQVIDSPTYFKTIKQFQESQVFSDFIEFKKYFDIALSEKVNDYVSSKHLSINPNIHSHEIWDYLKKNHDFSMVVGPLANGVNSDLGFNIIFEQMHTDLVAQFGKQNGDAEYARIIQNIGAIQDRTLFDAIFVESPVIRVDGSNNSLFDLGHNWGVRRIPTIEAVKSFTTNFLSGNPIVGTDYELNSSNVNSISDYIKSNNFDFIDLFTQQTTELFTIVDKSLNIFIPIVLSVFLIWYSSKKFKWSAR